MRCGLPISSGLRAINTRLIALLAGTAHSSGPIDLGLKSDIDFDDIYFDSTCLKAPIHFPVDWVLLRDATRTLMKALCSLCDCEFRPSRHELSSLPKL